MQLFIHRVNTLEKLRSVQTQYGIEIDIRGRNESLLLNHDPLKAAQEYCSLDELLTQYVAQGLTGGIIFNLKEAGYESQVIALAEKYGIQNYFLLDVEFPYLYRATRKERIRKIAIRYSEAEPIEAVEAQMVDGKPLLDWVWIDTNTQLPLNESVVQKLQPFKTCLVCPERWGRPEDIAVYAEAMKKLNFVPTAIMTSLECTKMWEAVM